MALMEPHRAPFARRWLGRLRVGTWALACALPAVAGTLALVTTMPACVGTIGGGADDKAKNEVAERSPFPRLTHEQWENTMRDLLRLDDRPGLTASFTSDPLGGIFDNNEAVLSVTPGLWADYQRAAEELSAMIVADPQKLGRIVPADTGQDSTARAKAFIEDFGRRAYRRPLTTAEVETHLALFAKGSQILGGDAFASGVALVLQAMLQSPHFIYRVEQSGNAREDGLIPLQGYEIASRLSYTLWNTMPDEMLLDAAGAGELATREGVRSHAERMLLDPRAHEVVLAFHRQLFDWKKYRDLYKDPALFPDFVPAISDDLQRESEAFVEDVVFAREGGLTDLLTSRTSFVNDRLAALYGVSGTFKTDEFTRVELDPSQRSGILTRIGFLAANGTARASDPIHRGVFINLRLLCAKLPPPPNNVTPLPPGTNKTTRERVDAHTGKGTCGASCHATLINPAGFAFEHYDAVGAWRTTDNGLPVDSAASYPLGGQMVSYDDAIAFSQLLAESQEAHRCFARQWLKFTYGRDAKTEDTALIERLGESSQSGMAIKDIVLELVTTDAFLTRRPVEAP